MSELVERLRAYAEAWDEDESTPDIVSTLREAADELERRE